jgi:hypothetical protein
MAQDVDAVDEIAGYAADRRLVVRALAVRPGRHEHGGGGQQVAEGVTADEPFNAVDGQQDAAERATDEPGRPVAEGV